MDTLGDLLPSAWVSRLHSTAASPGSERQKEMKPSCLTHRKRSKWSAASHRSGLSPGESSCAHTCRHTKRSTRQGSETHPHALALWYPLAGHSRVSLGNKSRFNFPVKWNSWQSGKTPLKATVCHLLITTGSHDASAGREHNVWEELDICKFVCIHAFISNHRQLSNPRAMQRRGSVT